MHDGEHPEGQKSTTAQAPQRQPASRQLRSFVQSECANSRGNRCIWGDCSVLAGARCHVSREVIFGQPTDSPGPDYFSACVAPLAAKRPEYLDAATEYAFICGARPGAGTLPQKRLCACGELLKPHTRLCARCRAIKRLEARRAAKFNRGPAEVVRTTALGSRQRPIPGVPVRSGEVTIASAIPIGLNGGHQ